MVLALAASFHALRADEPPAGAEVKAPTDRELYTRAASALLAKDIPEATSELSQLIKLYPSSELAPLAAIRLAECHLAASQWNEAVQVLTQWLPELAKSTQARTLEPASLLKAQALLGRAYMLNGQYAQLTALCEAQKTIYPDRSKLSEAESKALGMLEALVVQARQKQEEAQAIALRAAAAAVKDKQFAAAQNQLGQVNQELLSPAWLWRYHVLCAQCALGLSDPQSALSTLDKIKTEQLPPNEQAAVGMVRLDAAIALGKLAIAEQEINRLQALTGDDPRQGPSIALRAVELAMLRKDRLAADQLATAAKAKYPKFESQHEFDLLLARNALARVEFDQARTLLTALIQSPPATDPTAVPRACWLLGESYVLAQDSASAIEQFTRVIEANQPSAWMESSLLQRGKCYQQTSDSAKAIADFQRLIQEFPRSTLRPEALQHLQELGAPATVELNGTFSGSEQPLKEAAKAKATLK